MIFYIVLYYLYCITLYLSLHCILYCESTDTMDKARYLASAGIYTINHTWTSSYTIKIIFNAIGYNERYFHIYLIVAV